MADPILAPIIEVSANGLTQMQQLGLAGVFLSFIFIGGGLAIWYFAKHCEKRTEAAAQAYKDEATQNRAVISKLDDTIGSFQHAMRETNVGIQVALAKIETKIGD